MESGDLIHGNCSLFFILAIKPFFRLFLLAVQVIPLILFSDNGEFIHKCIH